MAHVVLAKQHNHQRNTILALKAQIENVSSIHMSIKDKTVIIVNNNNKVYHQIINKYTTK